MRCKERYCSRSVAAGSFIALPAESTAAVKAWSLAPLVLSAVLPIAATHLELVHLLNRDGLHVVDLLGQPMQRRHASDALHLGHLRLDCGQPTQAQGGAGC